MNQRLLLAAMLSVAATWSMAADIKPAADGAAIAAEAAPAALPVKKETRVWSWQPLQVVAPPTVKKSDWVRTPIDAFVLAKLEANGLKPSPAADRAAFIRRATIDAWGLIPTPEEVKAFVADRSPNAYEKLVDRLLRSPRYGERQARRWLDLARYADSTGFDNDETRPNAWRYRDYVINSFNEDKPYSRFIQEQIAGDELWPDNQNALVATGFLRGFPDNPNSRDLVQKKYQNATDITDTVGKVFLAQTVECARCHNHKFDKITAKDYFALQAFFANVSAVDDIPAQRSAQEIEYQQALVKYEEAMKPIRAAKKALIDPVRPQAIAYYKERYSEATLVSLNKPQAEWNAHDRWVNHAYGDYIEDDRLANYLQDTSVNKDAPDYNPDNVARWGAYQKLKDEVKRVAKLKPNGSLTVSAMTELGHADAPSTHVLFGGILERPQEEVAPAFPEALTSEKPVIVPTATSSGRRTALANWIASANNPLTARVYVNRIWEQYFGRGIVETVSDFGKAGTKPSNPELLDYLADNFIKEGWSPKKLHRQILLSNVYAQSSAHRDDAFKADPDNKLLAVFPRKRLEAEEIRDSLLVASGKLVDKIGGPSVFPPVPADLVTGNSNLDGSPYWSASSDPHEQNRRSIYIFTRRSIPYPLLQTFDMASAQEVHSKRDVTTTPLQALTLLHSGVVYDWSKALAGRVISEVGKDDESAEVDRLYQILFARSPDKSEKVALREFLDTQEKVIREKALTGKFGVNVPTDLRDVKSFDPIRAAAFVNLVHTVANSNEFAYRN